MDLEPFMVHGLAITENTNRKGTTVSLPLLLSLVEKEKSGTQCSSSNLQCYFIVFHLVILHGTL